MAYLTKEQVKQTINDLSGEHSPEDVVNSLIEQGHELEGFNEQPNTATEVGKGFVKGVIKSISDVTRGAVKSPLAAPISIGGFNPTQGLQEQMAGKIEEKTPQYSNTEQKIGGGIETAAEFLIPALATEKVIALKNALNLSNKELGLVKNLEYLKKAEILKQPTTGGILSEKSFKMPKQIKDLAIEFKNILTGNPEKDRLAAEKLGLEYKKKTLDLFNENTKLVNENTLRKYLEKALNSDKTTSYASKFEKQDVAKKAIDGFINKIKEGTNKGIEEARLAWRAEKAKTSGKLSQANEVIHRAIKDVVKNTLPEEKQILYNAYKQKMAKLFDIQEITKAKIAARVGTSLLKEGIKKVGGAGLAIGAWEAGKRLLK